MATLQCVRAAGSAVTAHNSATASTPTKCAMEQQGAVCPAVRLATTGLAVTKVRWPLVEGVGKWTNIYLDG